MAGQATQTAKKKLQENCKNKRMPLDTVMPRKEK